jgi:hypothetical protein
MKDGSGNPYVVQRNKDCNVQPDAATGGSWGIPKSNDDSKGLVYLCRKLLDFFFVFVFFFSMASL